MKYRNDYYPIVVAYSTYSLIVGTVGPLLKKDKFENSQLQGMGNYEDYLIFRLDLLIILKLILI